MKSVIRLSSVFVVAGIALAAFAQESHPSGPPQFVSVPILMRVGEAALDHGHFVFSEGAAIPSPLAPNNGTAPYSGAVIGSAAIVAGSDVNVSNDPTAYEGETGGAAAGGVIVGASNRVFPGACGSNPCSPFAYFSTDGTTWGKAAMPLTNNGKTFGICFDPGVDFDKSNNFYYSYGCAPLSGSYPNGIFVVKSPGGTTWSAPSSSVTFNTKRFFDDKYYIAVDRSNTAFANRVYVSWDRNVGNNQILYIAYSSDGGSTWSSPIKVNDGTSKFERVIGAYPAVDHNNGVVYDSWHDYAKNIIFVDKSSNGGVSWGKDVAAATTHAGFGTDIGCVGGRSQGPAHAVKVGPSGTLYLVYADPVGVARGFDILLTKSTDGGGTWSAPVTLNDDTGAADQFHPTLSVESNGAGGDKVTVTFYDRRDDPANCQAFVYATQSTDNAATWAANVRITTEASNFDGNANGPGDYSSSTPSTLGVFPFHGDHRASNVLLETGAAGGFEVYTAPVK